MNASLGSGQDLRDIRRGVAEAADAQVLQVVRMVDALEERGATDAVLAPVRPRLRAIQPARPLRFARLMFMPVDALIVAPKAWRAGTPFVPRNALMVLARAVRLAMSGADGARACLERVDALSEGATTAQMAVIREAGALLWPEAAQALRQLAVRDLPAVCRAEWAAESLPEGELSGMAGSLSGVLARALQLHDHDHSGIQLADTALTGMLASCEPLGPRAWGMMLSLLVIRAPQASAALLAAAQKKPAHRAMAEAAAEAGLDWLEAETEAQPASIPANAAADLNRQAGLLDALADQFTQPGPRRRLAQARSALLAGSLQRFEVALQERLAGPLLALPQAAEARGAALDVMEASARTLRAFELEARQLGAGGKFDTLVKGVEQAMRDAAGLVAMDRARLTEILAGPEAALRLLS